MAREISKGKCVYCDRELSKSAMTNHLKSCKQRAAGPETVSTKKSRKTKLLHLVVEGQYLRMYWMHLEVPTTITLADLDGFLRDIWLECCGHLSAFSIDGISYKSHLDPEYDDAVDEVEFQSDTQNQLLEDIQAQIAETYPPERVADLMKFVQAQISEVSYRPIRERSMNAEFGQVLKLGLKFTYVYDFGSSTELALKVMDEREGETRGRGKEAIKIMARNEPPTIPCDICGKTATGIYTDWDGYEKWLCNECGKKQKDREMMLPVVNSPRVGVCGYTG